MLPQAPTVEELAQLLTPNQTTDMNTEPETIAAVLAEMRREARSGEHADGPLVEDYASRIETAAELETESLRVNMESEKRWACEYFDLARRREDALTHCKQYAQKIERENKEGETRLDAEEIIATVDNEFAGIRPARAPGNAAALREALVEILDRTNREKARDYEAAIKGGILEIHDIANTALNQAACAERALSAPARNADRFDDPGKAWLAYKAECDRDETVPNMIGAISWLFASAEGGAE